MNSFLLDVYYRADETFYSLGREWESNWHIYALVGSFFLLLVFLRFVYLPRGVAAQAANRGVRGGWRGDARRIALITCHRCRSICPATGQADKDLCPYCGIPAQKLGQRRIAHPLTP